MRNFSCLAIFFICLALVNCSSSQTSRSSRAVPTNKRPMYQRATDVQTNTGTATASSQKNSPAISLVKEGIQEFKDEALETAQWQFEQAINLDPDYGPAYYWLARVRYKFNEIGESLNLLDKAASLLKESQMWLNRIEDFRAVLDRE